MLFVYVDYALSLNGVARAFYVGVGTRKRVEQRKRNHIHARLGAERGWYRVVVDSTSSRTEALSLERQLIRYLETRDHQGGANRTDGGGGIAGLRHSVKTRERMSSLLKGNTYKLGKKHTTESKTRISVGHMGLRHTKETRMKIASAHRGKKVTSSTREKLSVINTGKKASDETRLKMSASHTGMKRSSEAVEKTRAFHTGRKRSAETREKIRAAALLRNPATRRGRFSAKKVSDAKR
jgi:hypothetical protein